MRNKTNAGLVLRPATGAMAWVPPSNRRKMGGGTIDTCPSEHWYHHHDRHDHHDHDDHDDHHHHHHHLSSWG